MDITMIAAILIGSAICLPIVARKVTSIDRIEVLTRTGVRTLTEEEKSLTAMKLARAGIDMEPTYFQGIKVSLIGLYLIFVAVLSMIAPPILFLSLASPLVYFLPQWYLNDRIKKRKVELKQNLDRFTMFLSTALNSVPDTPTALHEAGKATRGAYEQEIDIVIKEFSAGKNLMDALHDMASRTDIDELNSLISSLSQIYVHGAPASEKMQEFADKIRESKKFDIMEQSGKLQNKLIIIVMVFMLSPLMLTMLFPAMYSLIGSFKGGF